MPPTGPEMSIVRMKVTAEVLKMNKTIRPQKENRGEEPKGRTDPLHPGLC